MNLLNVEGTVSPSSSSAHRHRLRYEQGLISDTLVLNKTGGQGPSSHASFDYDSTHSEQDTSPDSSDTDSVDGEATPMPSSSAPKDCGTSNTTSSPASGPDVSSHSDIPVEVLDVVRWARDKTPYHDWPDAPAWLVHSKANEYTGTNAKVWTTSEFLAELRTSHSLAFQQCPQASITHTGGFIHGQALRDISVPIRTCVGATRPRFLYRAVHDRMPHEGIGARGLKLFTTNGLFFQRHLQNHFAWICRQPSPFLSTSSELRRAVNFAAAFEARGYTGIKLLKISTTGEYWDHHLSRLFEVRHLLQALKLGSRIWHRNEYLVENAIPREHIVAYDWEENKTWLDRGGRSQMQQSNALERYRLRCKRLKARIEKEREENPEDDTPKSRLVRTTRFKSVVSYSRRNKSLAVVDYISR